MQSKKSLLLINPSRNPAAIRKLLRKAKPYPSLNIKISESKADFIQNVNKFCEDDSQYLLVWGGDGTAGTAINTMVHALKDSHSQKAIGFLRGGSGNGTQDSYEVPLSISRQLKCYEESIANNYIQPADVLELNWQGQKIYGQLFGMGFDAHVLRQRESWKVKTANGLITRPGMFNYLRSALKTWFLHWEDIKQEYVLDFFKGKYALRGSRINAEYRFQQLERKVRPILIELGTRPYYAKFFKICPDVVCNDGYLDAYIFNVDKQSAAILNVIDLWKGWHHRINRRSALKFEPLIERYEIKKIKIKSDKPYPFHIDGELYENTNPREALEISIVEQPINLIVPKTFYWKFHPFEQEN